MFLSAADYMPPVSSDRAEPIIRANLWRRYFVTPTAPVHQRFELETPMSRTYA
jgi:hypothetical protein